MCCLDFFKRKFSFVFDQLDMIFIMFIVLFSYIRGYEEIKSNLYEFNNLKIKFSRKYSEEEEKYNKSVIKNSHRYSVFKSNIDYINEENKNPHHTFTLGINKFADLTKEEFKSNYLTGKMDSNHNRFNVFKPIKEAPSEIDWRESGAVTRVIDQKACGSCYSIAAIGALESMRVIKKGLPLQEFSKSQIVDCSISYGNLGCDGGNEQKVYGYLSDKKKICLESEYPYKPYEGPCRDSSCTIDPLVRSFSSINTGDQNLKEAVAEQPISVSVNADGFQFYSGGIYNDANKCSDTVNHGVLVVGYGSSNRIDYWIVKNSWGDDFGEGG